MTIHARNVELLADLFKQEVQCDCCGGLFRFDPHYHEKGVEKICDGCQAKGIGPDSANTSRRIEA